jgi:hypothetical protein
MSIFLNEIQILISDISRSDAFRCYNYPMNKLIKKQLTIKTRFDPTIPEDVARYKEACDILEKQGYDVEQGIETVATEFLKKLYFRYSITTDFVLWVLIPLLTIFFIF